MLQIGNFAAAVHFQLYNLNLGSISLLDRFFSLFSRVIKWNLVQCNGFKLKWIKMYANDVFHTRNCCSPIHCHTKYQNHATPLLSEWEWESLGELLTITPIRENLENQMNMFTNEKSPQYQFIWKLIFFCFALFIAIVFATKRHCIVNRDYRRLCSMLLSVCSTQAIRIVKSLLINPLDALQHEKQLS